MNERIKQLADEARKYFTKTEMSGEFWVFDLERFAEKIVRECVGVVEGGRFLHDQAPTALFAKECSRAIAKHFGLKS